MKEETRYWAKLVCDVATTQPKLLRSFPSLFPGPTSMGHGSKHINAPIVAQSFVSAAGIAAAVAEAVGAELVSLTEDSHQGAY